MGKRKDAEFWDSARTNELSFNYYFNRLVELCISSFIWENMPKTVDTRFLELCLFSDGKSVFFEDKDIGFLSLRCATSGRWNVYQIPTQRRAYSTNGFNLNLDENNSVIIWNNYMHRNAQTDIELFAKRLGNLDRIIDVNANAQKTPILIGCDENELLTMKNLYLKYDGNQPVIFGDKNYGNKTLQVLKTDAPYVCDKLYSLKTQIWNEAMTYLGINNVNQTKKERLITDEVQDGQGDVMANRNSRLLARKQACEQINEMFGLNLDVKFNDVNDKYKEGDRNE